METHPYMPILVCGGQVAPATAALTASAILTSQDSSSACTYSDRYTSRPVRPELSGLNLRQNYGKSRSFDLYAACQFWNTVALEEARPACDPGLTELAGVGQVESELGAARTSRNRRRCAATRRFIVNWSEENSCSAQSKPLES